MTPDDLKKRREALGMTQSRLARELDVDVITVSRWERGVHPIPKYIELAVEAIETRRMQAA
ncbi:MAG TPA: helix-turn-helix domain-containing protein [Pyrinomonadaceae bacterium]|jgi:transcriptional regulator with XRE-family HTH domain|nr:helix-turn-helix domain-containing protein [Pyrinomonadaceae bacterium]